MSPDCATDVLQGATLGDDATILSEVGLEASRDCCPEQQSVLCRRGACHPWRWCRRSRRCHPWRCCHHGGVGFRRRVGFRGLLGLMPRRVVPVERTRGQEVPVEVPNRGAGGAERATSRAVGAGRTKSRGRWCRTSSSSRGGRSWLSVSGWRGVAWPSPNYGGEEADGSSVRIVVVFEEQRRWRSCLGAGGSAVGRGGCRTSELEGGRSGRGADCTARGRGRSVAATSGAQGRAPGVGADDGAAVNGCGVCRASTSNPPATRGEEGR